MSIGRIRAALETALDGMSPSLATAWENAPYSPVEGTPYQRVFLLPNTPNNPEWGTLTTERGFLQVSLYYPLDTGPIDASLRADLIRSTFKRGNSFTSGSVTVTVAGTPEIRPAMIEPDRYVLPVRIPYFSNFIA